MAKKFTYKEIKHFVEIKSNSGCKLLSTDYKNNSTKMLFKCKCGNEFETTFAKFKDRNKRQCNECGRQNQIIKRKLNIEDVRDYIDRNTNAIMIDTDYINNQTPIKLICECGDIFFRSLDSIKRNNSAYCDNCLAKKSSIRQRFDYDYIKDKITLEGFKLLSKKYINAKSKLDIKCPNGHIFKMNWSDFSQGNRCPECANISRSELFKTPISIVMDNINKLPFEFIQWEKGSYKNRDSKMVLECENGHQFCSSYESVVRNKTGCPHCQRSKGEELVKQKLDKYHINYIPQYTFDKCKHKRPLPFDFYLPDYNLLIEYDGEQHYEPVNFGGISDEQARWNLKEQQKRDNIKTQYCKDNGIELLRIPYWEFSNIEKIVCEKLNMLIPSQAS